MYIYIYKICIYIIRYIYIRIRVNSEVAIIEGSLEVKLPTIWTDEKQRWEKRRVEERREEERRWQKRKSQKKEVAKHCRCAKRSESRETLHAAPHVFPHDLWLVFFPPETSIMGPTWDQHRGWIFPRDPHGTPQFVVPEGRKVGWSLIFAEMILPAKWQDPT